MKKINLILLCSLVSCDTVFAQSSIMVDDNGKLLYPTANSFIQANSEFYNITAWGKITGTLSNQTDLQSALNLKANVSTTNSLASRITTAESDITNLENSRATTTYVNAQIENHRKYPRIIIDTSPTKSLDIEGNFTDFFTTDAELKLFDRNTGEIKYWVSTSKDISANYNGSEIADENVKIWFYMSALHQWGDGGLDFRKPIPFLADKFGSIAEQARAMIGSTNTPQINGIIIEPNINGNTSGGASIADIFSSEDNVPIIMKLSSTDIEKNLDGKYVARPVNVVYYKNAISPINDYDEILENEKFANWTGSTPTNWLKNSSVKTLQKITTGLPSGYSSGIDLHTHQDSISATSFTLNKPLAKGTYLIQLKVYVSSGNVDGADYFAMGFNSSSVVKLNLTDRNFTINGWCTKMFIVQNTYANGLFRIACYNPIKITGLSLIKIN